MDIKVLLDAPGISVSVIDCSDINNNSVREFRRKHKLSRVALANILNVSRYTISKWENNITKITGSSALLLKLLIEDDKLLNKIYHVEIY